VKPRNRPPAWNGLRECWECRAGGHSAKANVGIEALENIDGRLPGVGEGGMVASATAAFAQETRYDNLANQPFINGYLSKETTAALEDEKTFERAVQAYTWMLPALSMYSMKEGSEKVFGEGYNVLPIWKDRLNAKTLVTTPNSDVIYAMGYVDLKDGPLIIEAPPGLQGILDDFFQRPICTVGEVEGRVWCGDVGLPGPDRGKGGKYLLLPPDYTGTPPSGYFTYRSRTYGVFVFWRGFFKDPKQLGEPVRVMEQTRIYPLGKEAEAKPMQFPNASAQPADMLFPGDGTAFDIINRYIQHEYVDPADMELRGLLAGLGIVKGQPFAPDAHLSALLDKGARTAYRINHTLIYSPLDVPGSLIYPNRRWMNIFPGNAQFTAPTFLYVDARAAYFTLAYATSPGMAVNMVDVGAKYPVTFVDNDGNFLDGASRYKLNLPKDIPARLFWSVTVYDAVAGSGLDNGQPFPSINQMEKPTVNADGSTDIYFGPNSPGNGKNWIRTVPGQGFFVILRIYGPTQAFFDKTWVPSDIEKIN
jgi:hypothetical protein